MSPFDTLFAPLAAVSDVLWLVPLLPLLAALLLTLRLLLRRGGGDAGEPAQHDAGDIYLAAERPEAGGAGIADAFELGTDLPAALGHQPDGDASLSHRLRPRSVR